MIISHPSPSTSLNSSPHCHTLFQFSSVPTSFFAYFCPNHCMSCLKSNVLYEFLRVVPDFIHTRIFEPSSTFDILPIKHLILYISFISSSRFFSYWCVGLAALYLLRLFSVMCTTMRRTGGRYGHDMPIYSFLLYSCITILNKSAKMRQTYSPTSACSRDARALPTYSHSPSLIPCQLCAELSPSFSEPKHKNSVWQANLKPGALRSPILNSQR